MSRLCKHKESENAGHRKRFKKMRKQNLFRQLTVKRGVKSSVKSKKKREKKKQGILTFSLLWVLQT